VLLAVKQAQENGLTVTGQPQAFRHADAAAGTVAGQGVRLLAVNRVAALVAGPDAASAEELVRAARPYATEEVVKASRPLGATVLVPGVVPIGVSGEFWSLGVRPARRGAVLARYALGELKAGKAAVLLDGRDPLASELAESFVKEWGRKEGATAPVWRVGADGEIGELVQRVIGAKPEVVLLAGPLKSAAGWREALRKAGFQGPVLLGGEDEGADPVARLGAGNETYLVTIYAREGLSERGKEFTRDYEQRFGEAPDCAAAGAHDAALLAMETLPEAARARVRLREQLTKRGSFESVTGPVRWVEGQARRRVFVVRVGDKGVKVVKTIEPEEGEAK
jgi:branched-chain amino acid transport system substrate-binding protein